MFGAKKIGVEHEQNNSEVRKVLIERGIYPEKLPKAEDIKAIEKKVKQGHRLTDRSNSLLEDCWTKYLDDNQH